MWIVKDFADIPAEYRAIVDAHRKLGGSIRERATLATKLVTAIEKGDGKEVAKLERLLLAVKDKHVKLEEKEKSEREKYRSKVEADKKKAADRMEKLLRKEEDSKKKEEVGPFPSNHAACAALRFAPIPCLQGVRKFLRLWTVTHVYEGVLAGCAGGDQEEGEEGGGAEGTRGARDEA